jgi:hypothetical protein
LEGTEHRNVAFKTLLKNDSEAAKVIEQRMKKLVKLQVRGRGQGRAPGAGRGA